MKKVTQFFKKKFYRNFGLLFSEKSNILLVRYTTDRALLDGIASGDGQAFSQMYKQYRGRLRKWIVGLGGKEEDADDVFQEALMVIYEKAKSPDFCLTSKLGTYLFSISKRLWLRKIERSPQHLNIEDDEGLLRWDGQEADNDLSAHWEMESRLQQLSQALDDLGEPCSALLRSFYIDKKSMQEIAMDLGYTNADNAKNQKYKCLARLRKIFFSLQGLKEKR